MYLLIYLLCLLLYRWLTYLLILVFPIYGVYPSIDSPSAPPVHSIGIHINPSLFSFVASSYTLLSVFPFNVSKLLSSLLGRHTYRTSFLIHNVDVYLHIDSFLFWFIASTFILFPINFSGIHTDSSLFFSSFYRRHTSSLIALCRQSYHLLAICALIPFWPPLHRPSPVSSICNPMRIDPSLFFPFIPSTSFPPDSSILSLSRLLPLQFRSDPSYPYRRLSYRFLFTLMKHRRQHTVWSSSSVPPITSTCFPWSFFLLHP